MIQLHFRKSCSIALAVAALATTFAAPASASSHREGPFITRQPKVDATDFYMFRSTETGREGYVTLIANYIPLQDAFGGPNYFAMDPDALYEIHIDNNGDAREDLTFQFRFAYENKNNQMNIGGKMVSIPLIINGSGAISGPNSGAANVRETYTVDVVRGDRRTGNRQPVSNGASFDKPLDNIGNKAIADYERYANSHIYGANIPGCGQPARVFVGQRKDPFVVNLGETFDLINIAAPAGEANNAAETDSLANKNVTSIAIEVPTACLTNGTEPVIGGWTTASLRQGRLLNPSPVNLSASKEGGSWTQVSRLGMPLVNEVVIGLKDKDRFNSSKPVNDGQFADYVTNPVLPALIQALHSAPAPTNFPRTDLVAAFLTGVPTLNRPANVVASEMLRLNTGIDPATAGPRSRLGVIGGDNAGFPNGRRIGDDVVDIALRVVMGRLCTIAGVNAAVNCAAGDAPAGGADFTDGAYIDHGPAYVNAAFPYLKAPLAGSPSN